MDRIARGLYRRFPRARGSLLRVGVLHVETWRGRRSRSTVIVGWALGLATLAACASAAEPAADALPAPTFADDTATSGLDHAYRGAFEHFVGGGVALFDCDDDGRPDLYVAGGSAPAALYRNDSDVGGELRFDVVRSAVTDLDAVTGAYPIDLDSDGQDDLVVLRRGRNEVLRGLGDCRFEPATETLGLDGGSAWTVAFSAMWESGAALPTLAFGNYLQLDREACDDSELVRPTGDRYATPVPLSPGFCTLSALFSDWGRSGRRDLRFSNDRHYYTDGQEQLWRIDPGAAPVLYDEADGWRPLQIWGMGIASQDVTGDGRPDVFLTSQGDNKLQVLAGDPGRPDYADEALRRGATAHRPFTGGDVLPSTAWHPEFGDVNNDGLADLLVTKGNVEAQPDHAALDPTNLLIGQLDGTFVEGAVDAGIVTFDRARGAALVDLNLDGLLDIVVVHRERPVRVWRNEGVADGPPGRWLAIRVRQDPPNVDAIGAWLDVRAGARTWTREITVGGGHAGGQLGWVHVGLGPSERAEVRVEWPDGEMGPWTEVAGDTFVEIDRQGDVVTWSPPR
jgi:enediyne biosynthesis protein E4